MAGYPVRSAADLARLSVRQQEAWRRAGNALTTARREGISLASAARKERTTVGTVRRYYPRAVSRQGERGWYRASGWDRAYRGEMHITSTAGDVLAVVRDSRSRSLIAAHTNAVKAYLDGRDRGGAGLRRFRGQRVAGHWLADDRDLDLLVELAYRGELDWPDQYGRDDS